MNVWAFLGGFAAVAAGCCLVGAIVRKKLRRLSTRLFGTANLIDALSATGEQETRPRSVSGYDRFLIPQILKDFPDFDVTTATSYAKDYLRQKLRDKAGLRIHKIVLSRYLPSNAQKTVVFQAAAEYRQDGKIRQKRYDLYYTYLIDTGDQTVAANCPNCGGTLGYGMTTCPYCNSRVVNVMGNTWEFTEMTES